MGRPTKLTPQVMATIVRTVRAGSYIETAAEFAGIGRRTFYDWVRRGAREKTGIYYEFSLAIEQAAAEASVRNIMVIDRAAQHGQWQAAAWRLERKYPHQWGKRQVIQIGDGDDMMRTQEIDLTQYTDSELDDLEMLLKKGQPPKRTEEKEKA